MVDRGNAPWEWGRSPSSSRFTEGGSPFLALYREMNRTFDEFLRNVDLPMFGRGGSASEWPHVDVTETDKEVTVVAELPGVEEEDVEVTLAEGALSLKGEKKSDSEGAIRRERWYGAFERIIPLSPEVDPEKVSASFRNGVLTVTLGKRGEARRQVKRIPIGGPESAGGPGKAA